MLPLLFLGCAQATVPIRSLDGTEWVLSSLRGKPPIAQSNVTLKFERTSAGGYGGCNRYGGEVTAADGKFNLGLLSSTSRGCLQPGVSDQERAYLKTLGEVITYEMVGDRLIVRDRAGKDVLTFTRMVPAKK